ncbi:hypothetical protein [Streptomyces sp. NPDC047315]|uniref:hypothetical protein n=1 Tax=Streptomyces sp. NPDC047315 TaxID=3155142 RepID=UPI0033E00CBA
MPRHPAAERPVGRAAAALTVAERLAAAKKDTLLTELADQSSWDRFLVERAIFAVATTRSEFTANDLRELLPEMGHGFLGAAIGALNHGGVITGTGRLVPSTSPGTKGHGIHVWTLTAKGRRIHKKRTDRRTAANTGRNPR